ncbi:related to USO1 Intracellular protein transport protein [Phialocephala subalpina]|uniref:Related to USO1 Intracellular protein transport protein n=1 Tax=Phialocephala subalpina TaxID=576137 RepID=A0A1L7XHG9_9HELO|nr:related to USO1 Intracellular protein transport protein [Phialocephala subalpina]
MADLNDYSDTGIVNDIVSDDRPIAVRKKRRSSVRAPASRTNAPNTILRHGISTPPSTPRRTKKRVRFSDPGPEIQIESASSGLTPFIRRTSISSIPTTKRRHSTPMRLSNRAEYDASPISGEVQFAPLRQVLDGRVKRRLRRHRLSEEINTIEFDKRHETRERRSEVTRLREELAAKDLEVQSMRDEHDIASQLGLESNVSMTTNETLSTKVQELEQEIQDLKAELHRKESDTEEEVDWDMAARDPYDAGFDDDDDDNMVTNYDYEDTMMNDDEVMASPARLNTSFPSPPSSMPNTPCRTTSSISAGTQAELPMSDPEKEELKTELETLQGEIEKLNAAIAFNKDHQDRLTTKLTDFIPSSSFSLHNNGDEHTTLDSALDRVLTTLALTQSSSLEHQTAFSALSTEISNLDFGSSAPDETLELIASQFRQARLDLEYLCPGELSIGFENSKLLELLVDRVKALTQKVKEGDESVDQYHEQELLLRQQLGSRVEAMDELRGQLKLADEVVGSLRSDIVEKDTDNDRLRKALEGYREEVKGLEDLIDRVERESLLKEGALQSEIADLDQRLQHEVMRSEALQADSEGMQTVMVELQRRLSAAIDSAAEVKSQLDNLTPETTAQVAEKDVRIAELGTQIVGLKNAATEREQAHGSALALRDARVSELRTEIERTNNALKSAHATILTLRTENHCLNFKLQAEKSKGQEAVQAVLNIMGYPTPTSNGKTSAAGPMADSSSPVKGPTGPGLLTPASSSVVRRGSMFDAGLARRGSRKRRKYDSGLGFLSEGEEGEAMWMGEFSSDL